MKKIVTLVLWGFVALRFPAAVSIHAQQGGNSTSQDQKGTAKACILIFGAVRSPARIDFQDIRLKEAIQMAGGVTERASGAIQVIHSSSALICVPANGHGTVPA